MSINDELPDGRLKRLETWMERHRNALLTAGFVIMFLASIISGILALNASNDAKNANEQTAIVANQARNNTRENRSLLRQLRAEQEARAKETVKRVNQLCRGDEQEHKDNVRVLRQTYRILSDPDERSKFDPGLIQYAITNLPITERKARTDQAPKFCDKPGVGLPEPDPVVPKKRDFSHLLSDSAP